MKIFKILKTLILTFAAIALVSSCNTKKVENEPMSSTDSKLTETEIQARIDEYAPIAIDLDMSYLTDREKQLVAKLAEAGKVCDDIFWQQSSHDAISVRDSLKNLNTSEANLLLKLVNIYYGPYDKMNEYKRFVGVGADKRPECGGFYPEDMTKEEFEKHITDNPKDEASFRSLYTVIVRDENKKLKAVPYHQYYKDIEKLAKLIDEAAELCDNPSLKKYLKLRAKATRTDEYFESDWAWMELKDNNIDVVIGPIESYEDGIYNYKTAFEAVVMVKDIAASKELDMFKHSIDEFQKQLPWDAKYHVSAQSDGTILQMMNVAYFGGDCNKATKTIAAALPNDPAVYEKKGGKKSMYKNMMEAKFDKILKPISDIIISPDMRAFISKKHMVSFVTLHEVSHNLGRGFVYNNDKLTVKAALKEKYSPIEELKADICAMHNHKTLFNQGKITKDDLKKTVVTYIAGLFRSMRFGAESAHGVANYIQFRYLLEKGAIMKDKDGYYTFDNDKFFKGVAELAKMTLELQAEGNYQKASDLVKQYGGLTPELTTEFEKIKTVPKDINSTYKY